MADKKRDVQIWITLRDQFSKRIASAVGSLKRFAIGAKGVFNQLTSLRNLFLGSAVIFAGKKFIDAASKMEVFRKQLEAVTKTADEADQALSAIREFARTSPLETEDVVQSFVRLRAVGISPTIQEMTNLGGVAILFNREMSDVLDAFIGLNKRTLRALGIEIDRTGKKAIIMSGGIRKEVAKDSTSIRKALLETWEERFPNALEKSSDTFSAQMAILRSNIFEFQAQLGTEFLPEIKKITKAMSDLTAEQIGKIKQIKATIMFFVAVVRTVFNSLQIAARIVLTGIAQIGFVVVGLIRSFISLGNVATDSLTRTAESIEALKSGNFAAIPGIWKGFIGDVKGIPDALVEGFSKASDLGRLFVKQSTDDVNDMKNAWTSFYTSLNDIGAKKAPPGELPTDPMKPLPEKSDPKEVLRAQIKILEERLKLNKQYSDLIIENTKNEFTKRRLIADLEMGEALDEIKRAMNNGVITTERFEDMKTEIVRKNSEERRKIRNSELEFSFDAGNKLVGSAAAVANAIVQINEDKKNKMKPILYAQAVMSTAASTVTAVQSAWETFGSVNYVLGAVMAGAAVIENVALLAGQLNAINTAATGSAHTRAGRYLVGEHGPELVDMPANARITPTHQTDKILASQSQSTSVVFAPVFNGPVDKSTVPPLMNKIQQLGRDMTEAIRGGYLNPRDFARFA